MGRGLRNILVFFIVTAVFSVMYFFYSFIEESVLTEKDDWLAAQGTVTDYFMIELMDEETQQYQPNYKYSVTFTTEDGEERYASFWQKGAEPYEGQVVDLIYDPNSDDYAKGPLPEKKDFSKIYVARYVSIGYAGIVAAVYVAWLLSLKKKRQSYQNE